MPELFANFGWIGLVVGMSVVGVLLSALEIFFVSPRAGILEAAVGAAIISPLFFQESNFSLMVGNVPLITILIWIYFRAGHWVMVRTRL